MNQIRLTRNSSSTGMEFLIQEEGVGNAESEEKKQLRLRIASLTGTIISSGMKMLGIKVPEKM